MALLSKQKPLHPQTVSTTEKTTALQNGTRTILEFTAIAAQLSERNIHMDKTMSMEEGVSENDEKHNDQGKR